MPWPRPGLLVYNVLIKMATSKKIIQVAGPTAVGKTAIAIRLARHFNTEIISYDSRQCYQELCIGVARPSPEELAAVPHHFIASHLVKDSLNAAWFEQYALKLSRTLFERYDQVVMVGGTGLYWKAFAEGMDAVPAIDPMLRERITQQYQERGMDWLTKELEAHDPVFAKSGEMQNPQRMMRALEVMLETGQSILTFQKGTKSPREFDVISVGLELPRPVLIERINERVDQMMNQGLLEEVRSLMPYASLNALQTVGYTELFSFLNHEISLEEAVDRIKINTRQYAKRQMTWFRRDTSTQWFTPLQTDAIMQFVENKLN